MAEENKNAAPEEEYNDDGTKNPDYVAPKTESESEGTDTQNKGTKEEEENKDEEEFNDTIDPEKPPQIPVRESVAQHIIARKNDKIKKLESKLKEGDEGYIPPEKEEEDYNLSEEASEAINSKVESKLNEALAPFLGKIASDAQEAEFQSLVKSEPDAAKYANHIKAYMAHDAYKEVSPTVIYHHLAFQAAQALGAKRKKVADLEADQNKGGGRQLPDKGNLGNLPSAEDIESMSDADFDRMESDARQGKFIK